MFCEVFRIGSSGAEPLKITRFELLPIDRENRSGIDHLGYTDHALWHEFF